MTDHELLSIIDAARRHPRVADRIEHHITEALITLGWTRGGANFIVHDALISPDYGTSLSLLENELHHRIFVSAETSLAEPMDARAVRTFMKIIDRIPVCTVLDLGGGSGEIAMRIARYGCKVTIADTIDWRHRKDKDIAFTPVRHNKVRRRDESYDTVVALHVFHHSDDPEALLAEAFRLARSRVIFIESVTNDMVEYMYGCWVDWFYNRVIHYTENPKRKIPVPCRFLPATGWEQMVWRRYSLTPLFSQDLGIYQLLNPEHHHLFVYDK